MALKLRTAILISGRGSNMQALIEAAQADPDFPAEIALVISNRADAAGLEIAANADIETAVLPASAFQDREAYDNAMSALLDSHGIMLICLAGFMRILSAQFTQDWEGRLLNIHPSLLPKYIGLDTHARALAAGDSVHGCTVHHVTAELDAGPIIAQAEVPILPDDTEDTLAARVLEQEHKIYPEALRKIAASLQK